MQFGVIGSGSWATALVKILTDKGLSVNWWVRTEQMMQHIMKRRHNPNYLHSVQFDTNQLFVSSNVNEVVEKTDCVVIAIPSAYVVDSIKPLAKNAFEGKKVVSAVKGILPEHNLLLNDFLQQEYNVSLDDYYSIMGPCHAEEVASEKLSYLTFSGLNEEDTAFIAKHFTAEYINTVVNTDLYGVQYAAVLKNIYALGAGIAHGLEYGDNFLSVLIANAADEMAGFLQKSGIRNIEVGVHAEDPVTHRRFANYAASVYLGDLLVTCYSLYSRNRTFGNMIGKGYSVKAAQLELNMVAEGYNASKCIHLTNEKVKAEIPIVTTIYKILWEQLPAGEGFKEIEKLLV